MPGSHEGKNAGGLGNPRMLRSLIQEYSVPFDLNDIYSAFEQGQKVKSAHYFHVPNKGNTPDYEAATEMFEISSGNDDYLLSVQLKNRPEPKFHITPGVKRYTTHFVPLNDVLKHVTSLIISGNGLEIMRPFSGRSLEVTVDASLLPSGLYVARFSPI